MRKIIGFAVIAAFLSFVASAYGAVGYQKEGEDSGQAAVLNVQGNSTFDGSKVTIIANGHKDGVTAPVTGKVTDITGADFLSYGVINLGNIGNLGPGPDNSAGAGTARYIALGNGVKGQMLTITLALATGGTLYITNDKVSPAVFTMTKTGWDDIALNAALDSVTLLYVDDTYGWIIIGQNSVTVT